MLKSLGWAVLGAATTLGLLIIFGWTMTARRVGGMIDYAESLEGLVVVDPSKIQDLRTRRS